MPIANHEQYLAMLDSARKNGYAYPAVNVVGLASLNAALLAFAEAKSDGIVQVSSSGGAHATGPSVSDMALGAIVIAEAAWRLADKYDVFIALHTDHCHPGKLEKFMDPVIEESKKRIGRGLPPLFNSHMFDGSELPLEENLEIAKKYAEELSKMNVLLEIETGVVGGEEDGHDTSGVKKEKLYTTPEDMTRAYETLNPFGPFLLAATFGNVHGVYKPGNVVLKPKILKQGQDAVKEKFSTDTNPLYLVFHGGSGSTLEEIRETLEYGVVKMNIDTDTQYAFTRPIVDHMFKNYDRVLKVEGEVGDKKAYDPRVYTKLAIEGMKKRLIRACEDLRSAGKSIY